MRHCGEALGGKSTTGRAGQSSLQALPGSATLPSMGVESVADFFRSLPAKLDPEEAEGFAAVYQFDLSGPEGGQYYLVIEENACRVAEGVHPEPHVTLSLTGEDCVKVLNGRLDGPSAFLSGRVRVTGDLALAVQLRLLFPSIG